MKNKPWSIFVLFLSVIIIVQCIWYLFQPFYLKTKETVPETLGYNPEKEKLLLTFLDNPTVILNKDHITEKYIKLQKDSFQITLSYFSKIDFERKDEIIYNIHNQNGELQYLSSNSIYIPYKIRKEVEDSVCKSIVRKYFK